MRRVALALGAGVVGACGSPPAKAPAPDDPLAAACRGAVWHGMAADRLARRHGQASVQVLQLLDFLGAALRDSAGGSSA